MTKEAKALGKALSELFKTGPKHKHAKRANWRRLRFLRNATKSTRRG